MLYDPQGIVVICEVKTRSPGAWDTPAAAVTADKQRKLILAAKHFLQHTHLTEARVRFDVAEVIPLDEKHCKVRVIEDAFIT